MTFRCPNEQYYFERIPLSQSIEYRVYDIQPSLRENYAKQNRSQFENLKCLVIANQDGHKNHNMGNRLQLVFAMFFIIACTYKTGNTFI